MIGADTNLVLRTLLRDDDHQLNAIEALFASVSSKHDHVYISLPVITETVFVLLLVKKRQKYEVIAAIRAMLDVSLYIVEEEDAVRDALDEWESGLSGFNDQLIGALNREAGCVHTYTFDAELLKHRPGRFKAPW